MNRPLSVYAWAIALGCHFLLANGLWIWAGLLPGLLLVLPLALGLPGLIRRRRYTAGWLTLLLSGYIAGLMAEAASVPSRYGIALGFSGLAAVEFAALVLFVRWSARENGVARI
ncbi:MAG: DUF2069 domain-containing protein [Gammaproteobacteria bacterium]|jgi:uncharacterized membrane protein|uniref:DUF2069 domain-containing protein n=1 Tax=Nevskia sp. TaxID=1929292 RepID=UPI004035856E|nr:DUF2069 domain-containing protein [Gammaproteobacteria bacterium]